MNKNCNWIGRCKNNGSAVAVLNRLIHLIYTLYIGAAGTEQSVAGDNLGQ